MMEKIKLFGLKNGQIIACDSAEQAFSEDEDEVRPGWRLHNGRIATVITPPLRGVMGGVVVQWLEPGSIAWEGYGLEQ